MRFERSEQLIHLALMMQSSASGVGLKEIQDTFEVGRRTAERMRDAIIRIFPNTDECRRDDNTKAWKIITLKSPEFVEFSADDLAQMKMAIDILSAENLSTYANNLQTIWLKMKSTAKTTSLSRIETDLEAILEAEGYAMRPLPKPKISPPILMGIRESIKACQKIRIIYHSRLKSETTERLIHPYGLLYGMRHYLIAWCEASNGLRAFSLSNIKELTVSNESFIRDPDFNLRQHAARSFGAYQEEPFKVIWKFSANVAEDVKENHFHPTQTIEPQEDGSVIVTFIAGGSKEMCWHLLTWEGEVEIIEPQALKEEYKNMVRKIYGQIS